MTPPALRLTGLCHQYGSTLSLQDVSFDVHEDELVVVLGPSGAGKTTLLRTVAGLETPRAGRIRLHGEDVTAWSPARRDVAFVFQNFSLYPGWTVRRNLAFPLQAPGRQQVDVAGRVEWAARLLRIEGLLDRPAERLSGGEMQRVAIGRAIVRRPRLFLMDEPLTNLDAKLREQLRVELVVLRRELGIPMLYVTHDQSEALSMGDRVAVLSAGRVLQMASAQEIYADPLTPEVARQLGQPAINMIPLKRVDDSWLVDEAGDMDDAGGMDVARASEAQVVRVDVPSSAPDGDRLWFGIRPEAVDVTGGGHEGRVRLVEDTGPASILVVDWAGLQLHLLVDKTRQWRPGDRVAPRLDCGRASLWPRP